MTPTPAQKIEVYEALFHQLNLALVCCNDAKVREIVQSIDAWSYAHRAGNGEGGEEATDRRVDAAFGRLAALAGRREESC